VTRLWDEQLKKWGFNSQHTAQVWRPTSLPFNWLTGVLSAGVEQPGLEPDHLPPSTAMLNARSYTSTPVHAFMEQCLIKHKKRFII